MKLLLLVVALFAIFFEASYSSPVPKNKITIRTRTPDYVPAPPKHKPVAPRPQAPAPRPQAPAPRPQAPAPAAVAQPAPVQFIPQPIAMPVGCWPPGLCKQGRGTLGIGVGGPGFRFGGFGGFRGITGGRGRGRGKF